MARANRYPGLPLLTYNPDSGFTGVDTFTAEDERTTSDRHVGITVDDAVMTTKCPQWPTSTATATPRSLFRKGAWYAEGQPSAFLGMAVTSPCLVSTTATP